MKKVSHDEALKIVEYLRQHREETNREASERFGRSIDTIKKIRNQHDIEYVQPIRLGADYRRDFIINNCDEMTAQQMADYLGLARSSVTFILWKWRREQGIEKVDNTSLALCWDCQNATDFARCVWVDRFEVPEGAECDNGTITKCPYFEKDELTEAEYWERKRNDKHKTVKE